MHKRYSPAFLRCSRAESPSSPLTEGYCCNRTPTWVTQHSFSFISKSGKLRRGGSRRGRMGKKIRRCRKEEISASVTARLSQLAWLADNESQQWLPLLWEDEVMESNLDTWIWSSETLWSDCVILSSSTSIQTIPPENHHPSQHCGCCVN